LRQLRLRAGDLDPIGLGYLNHYTRLELTALATFYAALTFPAPETVYVVANDLKGHTAENWNSCCPEDVANRRDALNVAKTAPGRPSR
jgi:hypothetical protein